MVRAALALGVWSVAAVAVAQPSITRPVTDAAGVLSPDAVDAIEAHLHAHHDAGRGQIALLIVRTTGGVPINDYALRTGAEARAAWLSTARHIRTEFVDHRADYRRAIATLDLPTLFVHGRQDPADVARIEDAVDREQGREAERQRK